MGNNFFLWLIFYYFLLLRDYKILQVSFLPLSSHVAVQESEIENEIVTTADSLCDSEMISGVCIYASFGLFPTTRWSLLPSLVCQAVAARTCY